MTKYKKFGIETEEGSFIVKTPASKVTVEYAKVIALHWLKKQCGIVAKQVKNIKGIQ